MLEYLGLVDLCLKMPCLKNCDIRTSREISREDMREITDLVEFSVS